MGPTATVPTLADSSSGGTELPPRLLVSVRSIAELEAAVVGGADILDIPACELGVTQPTGEPLWRELIHYAALRAPFTGISVSLGELTAAVPATFAALPPQVRWVRFDMSNTLDLVDWQEIWLLRRIEVEVQAGRRLRWLATAHLQPELDRSPPQHALLEAAEKTDCAGVWLNVNTPGHPMNSHGVAPQVWTDIARRTREQCLPLFLGGCVDQEDIDWLCDLDPFVIQASIPQSDFSANQVAHWKAAFETAVLTAATAWS